MEINCLYCQTLTSNPKFCNRSCSASYNNTKMPKRKLTRKCSKCNSTIRNYRSLLCEEHFKEYQSNKRVALQSLTLADYTERECIKKLHPSSKFAHIRGLCRSWNKDLLLKPCHVCGYDKHVELAHIKSLSSFSKTATLAEVNSVSNVIQLCPNCHWEFDNGLISLAFPDQLESQ